MSIANFRAALRELTVDQLFDQYISVEECAAHLDFDQHALRDRIARRFNVSDEQVQIVGSAKLGFTLVDKYMDTDDPRPAFSLFDDNSDIDIAIVSDRLFDEIWKIVFEMWHSSGYQFSANFWPTARQFRNYHFRGWMRPDKLPYEAGVAYRRDWFRFFERLVGERLAGDHRINAGVFREPYFLKQYQTVGLERAKAKEINV